MIYIDPPYGIKFGSNFQPFVRRRDVKDGDDEHLTREPEMVQAYRDTWELGLHSYLTWLRDMFLLARELLHPTGSIFVQISDENVHHVREVLDEVFGANNFVCVICVEKTAGQTTENLPSVVDYILFYAKDDTRLKYRQLYSERTPESLIETQFRFIESQDGRHIRVLKGEMLLGSEGIPPGWRIFCNAGLTSRSASETTSFPFEFEGKVFRPYSGGWRTNLEGMKVLARENRLRAVGNSLMFKRYLDDFPLTPITNNWRDTKITGFTEQRHYVVQTPSKAIARCLLMTTDPGDLVLDPTCGSGTTAYVAEQWGRRWITIDVSRVPLALARQRLLTATFPWYELRDEARGPAGGFVYKRKQNKKGEEVGGIVPRVTLKSIANNEPPEEVVLVDRPEVTSGITRVTGPFCVEARKGETLSAARRNAKKASSWTGCWKCCARVRCCASAGGARCACARCARRPRPCACRPRPCACRPRPWKKTGTRGRWPLCSARKTGP